MPRTTKRMKAAVHKGVRVQASGTFRNRVLHRRWSKKSSTKSSLPTYSDTTISQKSSTEQWKFRNLDDTDTFWLEIETNDTQPLDPTQTMISSVSIKIDVIDLTFASRTKSSENLICRDKSTASCNATCKNATRADRYRYATFPEFIVVLFSET